MPDVERLDDLWWAEFEETDGVLYRRLFQPGRRAVMEENQRIKNAGIVRDLEPFGRWCLRVPHEDMRALERSIKWRDFACWDKDVRERAWRRFMQSPDSAPYRVRERAS